MAGPFLAHVKISRLKIGIYNPSICILKVVERGDASIRTVKVVKIQTDGSERNLQYYPAILGDQISFIFNPADLPFRVVAIVGDETLTRQIG